MASQGVWLASRTGHPYKVRDGIKESDPVFTVGSDPVWFKTKFASSSNNDTNLAVVDNKPPSDTEYAEQAKLHRAILDQENTKKAARRAAMLTMLDPPKTTGPSSPDEFARDKDEPDGDPGDLSKVIVMPPDPKKTPARRGPGKR